MMRSLALVALGAAGLGWLLKRRSAAKKPTSGGRGTPGASDVSPLPRTVIERPSGADTDDPGGQWADDGGAGVGGGQSQR